jgi:Ca2+-dependent lipid-binding protein
MDSFYISMESKYDRGNSELGKIIGKITVEIVEAKDLPAMDLNGKADPYVEVMLTGREHKKTSTQMKTRSPVWNEKFEFPYFEHDWLRGSITLRAYDWDKLTDDDYIGDCVISMVSINKKNTDAWYDIKDLGTKEQRGEIRVKTTYEERQ